MTATEYATISFRPPRKLSKEFAEIVEGSDLGKSEAAREVFALGVKSWKQGRATEEFSQGKLSFLSAASKAGMTAYEFLELLKSRGIAFVRVSESELERELALARS